MVEPTTQSLERIIRAYVAEGSGLDPENVIPGNENAPSPNKLYATVLLIDDSEIGTNQEIVGDADDMNNFKAPVTTLGSQVARYSVQFYRPGAIDACKAFRKYKSTPLGKLFLQGNNITLKLGSEIQRIDAIISDEFEERARIEIEVRYQDSLVQSLDTIGTVNVDVCYEDSGNLIIEEEVQINDT